MDLRRHLLWIQLTICVIVVVAASSVLPSYADVIAAESRLGRSFVGALFPGVSTSLPEITASLTAVRMGAIDLAIGNVLAVYDVFDGGDRQYILG